MKQKLFFFSFIFFTHSIIAQQIQLSPNAEVSVLTIGAGKNLNDAFGHSAFRIKDTSTGIDLVYGYGQYDFDAPNFYLNFAQGKLNYLISKNNFSDFYKYYVHFNRTIKEQILNLKPTEKQSLFNYLVKNYNPENRKYLYDFFYDNCATRIRDVVKITVNNKVEFTSPKNFEPKTFRQLIHNNVGLNSWGSFGIDIALGSVIDRQATAYQHMFLPEYMYSFFVNAKINSSEHLVKTSSIVFQSKEKKSDPLLFLWSPLIILSFLSFIIIYITYLDYKKEKQSKWLDIILFSFTGLIGIGILLLWFATNHTATAHNYNLLWAFPLNLIALIQLLKTKPKYWFENYLKFLIILLCLMTVHWVMSIQVFAIVLIPLLFALLIRYFYLIKFIKTIGR